LLELLKRDIKPLDIMTPKAFENGITTVMALGGSTNAVLHLLAMSRAAGCPLDLADFQRISDKTPFIADLKPSGKYLMEDLHKVCSPHSCICPCWGVANQCEQYTVNSADKLCWEDAWALYV